MKRSILRLGLGVLLIGAAFVIVVVAQFIAAYSENQSLQESYFPGHAAWFLQCKKPDDLFLVCDWSPSRTSAVSEKGDIYPQFCKEFWPYTEAIPPFWLVTYVVPPASHHELVVKDSAGTIEIKFVANEIVADVRLKAAENK